MEQFIDHLPGMLAITFICGGWVIYAVVNSIATNGRKARVTEQNAVLKKEMLDKGFSADDIVRVLAAGADADAPPADASDLTGTMIAGGYDAADIAAVTGALDATPPAARDDVRRAVAQMVANEYDGGDIAKFVAARNDAAKMAGRRPDPAHAA